MPKTLRKQQLAVPEAQERAPSRPARKQKLPALLVTSDETLWPQIGADLGGNLQLKQMDSIDELITTIPPGQPAVVLWDARNHDDPAAVLSRLNQHSTRFALIALDNASAAAAWALPTQHRQVVAHVALPIAGNALSGALDAALEEVNARMALLGDGSSEPPPVDSAAPGKRWVAPAIISLVLAAAAAAFLLTRHGSPEVKSAGVPAANKGQHPLPAKSPDAAVEKIDALIEKAQQAMSDRHFIDPAAGSALSLYREVLVADPNNGEARQGLQRLSEILIARVQSALDDRKFDVALQSLETARSIDANDHRLVALDERIVSLRAELGPAQIMAALNAQNFDRATQLIDEAARTKSVPAAKLAQLRDEVRRRHEDFDVARLLKLVDTRIQQDHVIDPRNDSAVYYLDQARQAGASAAALQPQYQDLLKRLTQATHSAIEQHRFSDADRLFTELRTLGAPAGAIAPLQHELTVARGQAAQKPDQPQYLELAQARMAQGKLTAPDNDSALYYVAQLRAADPKSASLAQVSGALQAKIMDSSRTALDAGDIATAEAQLQFAAGLGGSAEIDALTEKVRQKKSASSGSAAMSQQSLVLLNKLEVQYPMRAMQEGTEGWVEIGFTILPDGSVGNIQILGAAPARTFEAAATKAVSKLRYQPVMEGGKAISVATHLRVTFRIPK